MTQHDQFILDLPSYPALGRDDFLVTPCNAEAMTWVEGWPDWPATGFVLSGPYASGKSHLLAVWCGRSSAIILDSQQMTDILLTGLPDAVHAVAIDDAQTIAGISKCENALFHIINILSERGGSLFLTALEPPSRWPVMLPDLASRLALFPTQRLHAPDDDLLCALLVKQFADRQLHVKAEVISFLLPRMERSFSAVSALVESLDTTALREGRAVTIPLARRILDQMMRTMSSSQSADWESQSA